MDAYRDEGLGDVIVGKRFCIEVCLKARTFDGMITIYNGNDSVTYQMARSHPMFKHLTNAYCNKIRPLLKERRDNTISGSDNEDANKHIVKVLDIVDLFLIPETRSTNTSDRLAAIQAQLNNLGMEIKKVNVKVYAAHVGCESCGGQHYTKDCPLKGEGWCMTQSSTKELLTSFENPEQVLRSRKKLFNTPSLVESNSPEFDQLFEIGEHIEEEVTMTETMKQYMSKTRGDYESGITRPSISQDTHFELKGKFPKELCDNTFSGSEHEDENEHIEKVLKIVDLFHILKGAIPSKTNVDAKIAIQEMAEYSQKWHNGTSSKTKSTETSDGLAAIQAQLNNLGREIKK
uniref:Eukaryotic translation initiation factor 3 subunit G N-terminal domain-containing protein n=1 Tax=Tanacetum cinerariifolium TaxID=118510 RepID=A0A6L2K887_TANCI|nr:hypothetical protein [Tanacetum cinerariifolium]